MLSVVIVNVVILNVVMLSVVMLSVVAPHGFLYVAKLSYTKLECLSKEYLLREKSSVQLTSSLR
jgi:hypothetical protein